MIDNGILILMAFLWGLLLGVFYFGGLWLTVRVLPRMVSRQGSCLILSFALRLVLALAGMAIVLKISPVAFFVTLTSFLMVRPLLTMTMGRT